MFQGRPPLAYFILHQQLSAGDMPYTLHLLIDRKRLN